MIDGHRAPVNREQDNGRQGEEDKADAKVVLHGRTFIKTSPGLHGDMDNLAEKAVLRFQTGFLRFRLGQRRLRGGTGTRSFGALEDGMGDQLRKRVVQEVNAHGGRTMSEERFIHEIGQKCFRPAGRGEVAIAQSGPEASRTSAAENKKRNDMRG
jgi:hypothetical protein